MQDLEIDMEVTSERMSRMKEKLLSLYLDMQAEKLGCSPDDFTVIITRPNQEHA